MKVTILGCGASSGVPVIGCDCAVCRSDNPRNKRTRVSVFCEVNNTKLLIDSSPDLRQQVLRHDICHVDAVLYTHDHADHTLGADDLRSFNYLSGESLPVYGTEETLESIRQRFPYAFQGKPQNNIWYRPSLTANVFPDIEVGKLTIKDSAVTYFQQIHGRIKTTGYRIGDFAYSTDLNALPDSAFDALKGIEVWVVDCLRHQPSLSHSHLEQTLAWIKEVKPRLAVLTHMSHELDYDTLAGELPRGVVPGYDGMVIEL